MPDALIHSIRTAGARHVIASPTLLDNVQPAIAQLPPATRWWVHGEDTGAIAPIPAASCRYRSGTIRRLSLGPGEQRSPSARDRALLIYTSGTTGLPKAANVSQARIMGWSDWSAGMMNVQPSDRLYNCPPRYHSVGGVVAVGSMLVTGASVIIRQRFSSSTFWGDVAETGCTIVQYIGELCRYLLQSPRHARETDHHVRLFYGNGLRGDVWPPFQRRFQIPHILEFYAATEGSVSLYNCEGKPGAIGRVPAFLTHRFPLALIRCDPETGEAIRNATGRCVPMCTAAFLSTPVRSSYGFVAI